MLPYEELSFDKEVRLIVLEGPAGAGKSFMTKMLKRTVEGACFPYYPYRVRIDRPRTYDGAWGIQLSMAKDAMAYIGALNAIERSSHQKPVVLIDRFVVSQWVYGTIRNGYNGPGLNWGVDNIGSAGAWMRGLTTNLPIRTRNDWSFQMYQPIHVDWVFLIPELKLLEYFRAKSDKEYPYPAGTELAIYSEAGDILAQALPRMEELTDLYAITASATVFRFDEEEDAEGIARLIGEHYE